MPGMEDQEVEQLLNRADSLTAEIMTDTGLESPETDSDHNQGTEFNETEAIVEPGGSEALDNQSEEPDAEEAASQAVEQVKELNDLLRDPDASPTSKSEGDATEEKSPPPPKKPEADGEKGSQAPDDEMSAAPTDESDLAADGHDDALESKLSIKQKIVTASRSAVRVFTALPVLVLNSLLKSLIWLDRPFANIPTGVKRGLGIVALATLLAGIATWVLPTLLSQNPFEDMDRYTTIRK